MKQITMYLNGSTRIKEEAHRTHGMLQKVFIFFISLFFLCILCVLWALLFKVRR